MANIGFYSTHVFLSYHYETELELIEKHLLSGDKIFQFVCNANFEVCDVNPEHHLGICYLCMKRRKNGNTLLSESIDVIDNTLLNDKDLIRIKQLSLSFNDLEDLKSITFKDFDIGMAVASSIISLYRDSDMDLNSIRSLVEDFLISSAKAYLSVINLIERNNIDTIYIFNGRFAQTKAVLRACEHKGIRYIIHERGSSKHKYALFRNALSVNIQYVTNEINQAWKKGPDNKEAIGAEYFQKRMGGLAIEWHSFVNKQDQAKLPDNWLSSKRNIAIFNSSEDESEAIGPEWTKHRIFPTQIEAIIEICKHFSAREDFHIYIRCHPNLTGIDGKIRKSIEQMKYTNFTYIAPESDISTYTLIRACEKVVTFGSSVGIEAVYLEKPSILAGGHFYRDLGSTFNAKNREHLMELIEEKLTPKSNLGALKYGFYRHTFGEEFKYFQVKEFGLGYFKGVNLKKQSVKDKVIYHILNLPAVNKLGRIHRNRLKKNIEVQ